MAANSLVNNFQVPNWAGKPPPGLHLDVLKDGKMIQKLMIDEKKCYYFGRNKQLCDFCIDHASSSRVHAALVWHQHLNRPFIIDLGSTHGTFIGNLRLDSKKPQQVPIDSIIRFGASTRTYIVRERPQTKQMLGTIADYAADEIEGGTGTSADHANLPDSELELDNLTEFNTAHNRRITGMSDLSDLNTHRLRRKSTHVHFNEEDVIINPEDIDPLVGRFRNLVQTIIIPKKKARLDISGMVSPQSANEAASRRLHSGGSFPYPSLYEPDQTALGSVDGGQISSSLSTQNSSVFSIAAKLGLKAPNLAPDIESIDTVEAALPHVAPKVIVIAREEEDEAHEPKKKKYAKEAWPGKKPNAAGHSFLV